MGSFAFWAESLLFPLIALIINAVVRWRARMPQSTPADLILLLWIFDIAVILNADTFSEFTALLASPNDLRAWFMIIWCFNIVLWLTVLRIEYIHARGTASWVRWFTGSRSRAMVLSFAASIVGIATNIVAFAAG
jgi:hypothetical protein